MYKWALRSVQRSLSYTSETIAKPAAAASIVQGADPNAANLDEAHPLDLACTLDKWGHVQVASHLVPVHALLVGFGGRNSDAFLAHPDMLSSSKNSSRVLLNARSFGSVHLGQQGGKVGGRVPGGLPAMIPEVVK